MALFNRHIQISFLELGVNIGGHYEYGDDIKRPILCEFSCTHKINETINDAKIIIYNLKKETRERISVENTLIEIESGYIPLDGVPNIERVFLGRSKEIMSYASPDGVDIITEISCGDGQRGYLFARINRSLPPGANSYRHQLEAISSEFSSLQIPTRVLRDASTESSSKPVVMHGSCRYELDRICRDDNLHWNITDEKLEIFSKDKQAIDNKIYTINSNSGMIGSPKISNKGMAVECLLIPALRPGRIVEIQSKLAGNSLNRIEKSKFYGSLDVSKKMSVSLDLRAWNGSVRRDKLRNRGDLG